MTHQIHQITVCLSEAEYKRAAYCVERLGYESIEDFIMSGIDLETQYEYARTVRDDRGA